MAAHAGDWYTDNSIWAALVPWIAIDDQQGFSWTLTLPNGWTK
jgi:hypothetical protein